MSGFRLYLTALLCTYKCITASAQVTQKPVQWTASCQKITELEYDLLLTATVLEGWELYAEQSKHQEIKPLQIGSPSGASVPTIANSQALTPPQVSMSVMFGIELPLYKGTASWQQRLQFASPSALSSPVSLPVQFMASNNTSTYNPSGVCVIVNATNLQAHVGNCP